MQTQLQPTAPRSRSSARAPADAMLPATGKRRQALRKQKAIRVCITTAAAAYIGLTGLLYWLSPETIRLEMLCLPVAALVGWVMGAYGAALVAFVLAVLMLCADARVGLSATS